MPNSRRGVVIATAHRSGLVTAVVGCLSGGSRVIVIRIASPFPGSKSERIATGSSLVSVVLVSKSAAGTGWRGIRSCRQGYQQAQDSAGKCGSEGSTHHGVPLCVMCTRSVQAAFRL